MTVNASSRSDAQAQRLAYQKAIQGRRPRLQMVGLFFGSLVLCMFVPGIALCGWATQKLMLWTIAGTTLATGICYIVASRWLERKALTSQRVDDLLFCGILLIVAALVTGQFATQSGPIRLTEIDIWTTLLIAWPPVLFGIILMHRRAIRLSLRPSPDHH